MNRINNAGSLFNGPFILSWRETERQQAALNPTRMYVIPLKLPRQNSINTPVSGTLEGLK
jgi:hypothetical protein